MRHVDLCVSGTSEIQTSTACHTADLEADSSPSQTYAAGVSGHWDAEIQTLSSAPKCLRAEWHKMMDGTLSHEPHVVCRLFCLACHNSFLVISFWEPEAEHGIGWTGDDPTPPACQMVGTSHREQSQS